MFHTRETTTMKIRTVLAAAATLALISGGTVYAQTAPADTAATPAKKERSAKSLECSKQADAKGLHGKERKKFRSECKKG
jgi:hypothetical protein